MENVGLKSVIEKLESLFTTFNEKYYDGELEKPILTVSPDVTSGAYGWATSWRAWQKKSKDGEEQTNGYYEINICAEYLSRPFKDICSTLLHEMVHLYNLQNEVKDTSRGGKYHNKKFKEVAEQHGLIIDKDERYGWTLTSLSKEAELFVESMGENSFELYRTKMVKMSSSSKQSTRKYVCPSCGMIVRATKEVNILCGDCDLKLELEE